MSRVVLLVAPTEQEADEDLERIHDLEVRADCRHECSSTAHHATPLHYRVLMHCIVYTCAYLFYYLQDLHLLDYSVMCPHPPVIGAVVIVDPFSTGANLAAMAFKWGYRVILVFSERDSPIAKLVRVQWILLIAMVTMESLPSCVVWCVGVHECRWRRTRERRPCC